MGVTGRVEGLKPDKGLRNGSCNRTACQTSGATYLNWSTHAYYCQACARLINRNSPPDRPFCTIDPELAAQQTQQRLEATTGLAANPSAQGRNNRPGRL